MTGDNNNSDDGRRRWKGPSEKDASRAKERTFATKQKVRKGGIKKKSSRAWVERQLSDPYVRRAQEAGYRARAAFKLIEINDRFGVLRRGQRIVDLGCAPGSWTQVALEQGAVEVVGIDLLEVEPIAEAELLVGDINDPDAIAQLLEKLTGAPDLVLSDMAAATTGHKQTDHLRTVQLAEMAAKFAVEHLSPGGHFVTKVFQGGAQGELKDLLDSSFRDVRYWKPPASRSSSPEMFAIAKGFRK